jgi:Fur family ferric uptake transcriptional regulator
MNQRSGQDVKTFLRTHHLKATPIRLEILGIFERMQAPMGIPEIHKAVEKSGMNYVSVYRTVQAFAEAGIIRSVNLRHGHTDYELVRNDDHHHLVCTGCGKIEEFDDCGMEDLMKAVLKRTPSFRAITDHAVEFFGTCNVCVK